MLVSTEQRMKVLLAQAGILVGGNDPADIQVKNKDFFRRVLAEGSLGLGESYEDGWWECGSLDKFFCKILRKNLQNRVNPGLGDFIRKISYKVANMQSKKKAGSNVRKHYDIGDDLFTAMLDPYMQYSCGYFNGETNKLNDAQFRKMSLVCEKLKLFEGESVLDIGCGWGGLAEFIDKYYRANVLGVTRSENQFQHARLRLKETDSSVALMDYRDLDKEPGQYLFDKVVSVGMFEHVGPKNYRRFMEVACNCLRNDGLFLLHTIGGNTSETATDPWLDKYIFPGSVIPSVEQIVKASKGLFVIEDWHNFGTDYAKTLRAWMSNFDEAWPSLKGKYSERFYRRWKYYLLSCAGSFDARHNHLWQIVLSKNGVLGGYRSVR